MNFSFHFQSCLKLQQNHNWGNITSFFLFYTIYKTLLNYVQDIRLSRPENYIMFLGCHTDINVLMSSKNNIVQLTSCYFSLCFEGRNGLWDFKGFIGYKKQAKWQSFVYLQNPCSWSWTKVIIYTVKSWAGACLD